MSKVQIISDLSLQVFLSNRVEFEYSDDVLLHLQQKNLQKDTKYVIFIDCSARFYEDRYLHELILEVTRLRSKESGGQVWITDLFFNYGSPIGKNLRPLGLGYSSELYRDIEALSSSEYTVRLSQYVLRKGQENIYNHQFMTSYQLPYSKEVIEDLEELIHEEIQSQLEPIKKVLVLDCDNTLWGGVLGEDLVEGIQCDRAKGRLYYEFQLFLKKCKNAGYLLALNTKNNEQEVVEAFTSRRMPLKLDDFVTLRANWFRKSANIDSIVKELNVGLESVVFIDDNPAEIEEVKSSLGDVKCFQFINDWGFLHELMRSRLLINWHYTTEDIKKSDMYRAESARKSFLAELGTHEDYISSLKIELKPVENFPLERLIQLSEKTNQFNFNKTILNDLSVQNFIQLGHRFTMFKLTDKFGEYGIIGYTHVNEKKELQNFVLSCRALGKQVEQKIIEYLLENNFVIEYYHFLETKKNIPAKLFINNYLSKWKRV